MNIDDEREAWRDEAIRRYPHAEVAKYMRQALQNAFIEGAKFAAGFHRTVVPEPSADARISRAIAVLSWRPEHDGDDPVRVQNDYMRRAQPADTALAILTENREGAF